MVKNINEMKEKMLACKVGEIGGEGKEKKNNCFTKGFQNS